jgi:hypothetical protein
LLVPPRMIAQCTEWIVDLSVMADSKADIWCCLP